MFAFFSNKKRENPVGSSLKYAFCTVNSALRWLLADVSKDTSVNIEHMAVNGIRSLRSQEHCRTTELRWIEPTSSRSLSADE
jgi:hypothetical protein